MNNSNATSIVHPIYSLAVLFLLTLPFLSAQDPTTWIRTYGGTAHDAANSVQQASDGGYIFAGYTSSGRPSRDFWLVKTDANGDTLWTKTWGGSDTDEIWSVQQTTDGGYVLSGKEESSSASTNAWLSKTDTDGNILWTKIIGGSSTDHFYSVQQTTDGGYILAGMTYSFGANNMDAWLVKTDSLGNTQWQTLHGSLYEEKAGAVRGFSLPGW